MKRMWKTIIAMLLVVVMIGGAAPIGALAELDWPTLPVGTVSSWISDGATAVRSVAAWIGEKLHGLSFKASAKEYSGSCGDEGDNVKWTLDTETGVLTISGTGRMTTSSLMTAHALDIVTVNIGYGVMSISRNAFAHCENLISVSIPDSVTYIDAYAFSGCFLLTSVTIPSGVTGISDGAFSGTGLCSIVIPDNVTSIGSYAFARCDNLTDVLIGKSLKIISMYSFNKCDSLTSITIPDNIEIIGEYAFSDCTSLTNVSIGSGVSYISYSAFFNCERLSAFRVDSRNPSFFSDADGILYNKDQTELVRFPAGKTWKSFVIPNQIISLSQYAFCDCTNLTSVTIPNEITVISDYVFKGCTGLTQALIPDSVKQISDCAYMKCTGLTHITIPHNVKGIGTDAFSGCSGLRNVTIEEGVQYINSFVFRGCTALTSIVIPKSVLLIGTDAFKGCSNLSCVVFLATDCITVQGLRIIKGELQSYTRNDGFYGVHPIFDKEIQTVSIGDSVRSIPDGLFYGCVRITDVKLPESVTKIGNKAFSDCTGLSSVMLSDSLETIGKEAFSGCTALIGLNIPTHVKRIENAAFSGAGITELTVPGSVAALASDAFKGCANLASIVFENGTLTEIGRNVFNDTAYWNDSKNWNNDTLFIGKYLFSVKETISGQYDIPEDTKCIAESAFSDCKSLRSITIPNSMITIPRSAFFGCQNLVSILIPNSIHKIDLHAFNGCTDLADVYYTGNKAQWDSISVMYGNWYLTDATIHYNSSGGIEIPKPDGIVIPTPDKDEIVPHDLEYYADHLSSSEYDPELAYTLMSLSYAAYDKTCITNALDNLGFDTDCAEDGNYDYTYISDIYDQSPDEENFAAFSIAKKMVNHSAIILITVRGTGNTLHGIDIGDGKLPIMGEWFSNIFMTGSGIPLFETGTNWHQGYKQVADLIWEKLDDVIYNGFEIPTSGTKFFLTGHSRGAGIANLLAIKLHKYGVSKDNVYNYNFACPDSAADYPTSWNTLGNHSNIFNVCNCQDLVAYLPGVLYTIRTPLLVNWGKYGITKFFSFNWDEPGSTIIDFAFDSAWTAHAPRTYLTYLRELHTWSESKDYNDVKSIQLLSFAKMAAEGIGKLISTDVYCPVDVRITDRSGNLMATVIRNVPTHYTDKIWVSVSEDKKTITYFDDDEIQIEIIATDSGEMHYAVYQYSFFEDKMLGEKEYDHIRLSPTKKMTSIVSATASLPDTELYVLDAQNQIKSIVNTDGSERPYVSQMKMLLPTKTVYKKQFTVSLDATNLPAGARVEWTADNAKVQLTPAADGKTCTVKSAFKGTVTLTVTVYGTDGEKLAQASAAVVVQYAWWQWLVRIFLLGFLWY